LKGSWNTTASLGRKLALPGPNQAIRASLQAQFDRIKQKIHAIVHEEEAADPVLHVCKLKAKRKEVKAKLKSAQFWNDDERCYWLENQIERIEEDIEALEEEIFNAELDKIFGKA